MKTEKLLSASEVDSIVEIRGVKSGHKARIFLADLGVLEGVKLRIIKNNTGPIIVEVKGTRVAIGRGIAHKIEVL
ncbi:MAG: ferrous iron transport protein A [Candidatus Heimdallarchaeota archaeon]|nr:ferrous iron transport protein A [Candidatus Heimdallarchaeota archaeon]